MKTFVKIIIAALLITTLHFTAYAQTSSEDSLRVDLEEITVEATHSSITIGKAPMALSYFTRSASDLTSRPAATMDELTFTLPGVFISNRENFALGERMTVRGLGWRSQFGVRGVQVILDGIPLTVADGQTIMNMVDPATIERIELLRGPSATFWGNSSGGVLYMSSKPSPDAPRLQYRGYGGSYGTMKQELKFNTQTGSTRLYGYASYFDTEGFRDYSAATMYRGSVAGERSIGNSGNLTLRATYASMPKAQHPGSLNRLNAEEDPTQSNPFFSNNFAGKTFEQAMIAGNYFHAFDNGSMTVTANGTWRDLDNPLPFGYIGVDRYAGTFRSVYQFDSLNFDWNIGGELKLQRDDRLETNIVDGERGDDIRVQQLETVTNQAMFTRVGFPVNKRLTLNAGLRADWLQFRSEDELGATQDGDRMFFAVNPSAGLSYLMENSRLYGNISTSFESPTTVELVNRPEGGAGFNQNLNPERTLSIETGVNGNFNQFSYDLAIYGMRVYDLINTFQIDQSGENFFRNEGNSLHYGLESAASYTKNNLKLSLMLNLMKAEFEDGQFEGNSIPGVPSFRFGANLMYRLSNQTFSLDNEWIGSYQTDSANSENNDAYSLFHLRWVIEFDNLISGTIIKPFVSVQNLLNTRYNTSVAINNAGGRYFEPGTDRSYTAGVQINFR